MQRDLAECKALFGGLVAKLHQRMFHAVDLGIILLFWVSGDRSESSEFVGKY